MASLSKVIYWLAALCCLSSQTLSDQYNAFGDVFAIVACCEGIPGLYLHRIRVHSMGLTNQVSLVRIYLWTWYLFRALQHAS